MMKVYFSPLAQEKLIQLSKYLLEEWGRKAKKDFLTKLDQKVIQISNQPESCPESSTFKGIFKCVITKHTTFYYRVLSQFNKIEIITLFDTRRHPDKLSKDLL